MQTLLSFIVVIGILVVVHEFGHYLAAKSCGVRVLRFSVGFGRIVWRRQGRDGTEWALSLVPLGGYVKMLDEREAPVAAEELPRAFNRQSLAARSWIVVAGPLANFLFAVLAYWLVFMVGTMELRPFVAEPPAGTPAAQAGFAAGERVLRVEGEAVETWQALRWALVTRANTHERVDIEALAADGSIRQRTLQLRGENSKPLGETFIADLGLSIYRAPQPAVIGRVMPGSAAEAAGLLADDRVVAIDDEPVGHWGELAERVQQSMGRTLAFEVERGRQRIVRNVTPRVDEQGGRLIARIGVQAAAPPQHNEMWIEVRHGPIESAGLALVETWDKSVFTLKMFGRMLTGEVSWRNLSGPVTIADYAGQSAQLGFAYFVQFLALVSISLGVLNLLPIPLLDGGHLMYHAYEAIRRVPPSERAMEISQRVGLALLVLLMVFAFYNDIHRLVSG
jgi:regulator of sigma E protease